jgi:hypothetical protein
MSANYRKATRKEEKDRKKRLLRAFKEDEQAKLWNKIVDEVGGCNIDDLDSECYTLDFLDPESDPESEYLDEPYPNKIETRHNIFECD